MQTALEEIAATAEQAADEQRQVARRARTMQRQRDRGWSWSRIMDRDALPGVFDLLRSSARRGAEALSRLGFLVAKGLASEGESRRRIAGRLGVTHQRIAAMLKPGSRR